MTPLRVGILFFWAWLELVGAGSNVDGIDGNSSDVNGTTADWIPPSSITPLPGKKKEFNMKDMVGPIVLVVASVMVVGCLFYVRYFLLTREDSESSFYSVTDTGAGSEAPLPRSSITGDQPDFSAQQTSFGSECFAKDSYMNSPFRGTHILPRHSAQSSNSSQSSQLSILHNKIPPLAMGELGQITPKLTLGQPVATTPQSSLLLAARNSPLVGAVVAPATTTTVFLAENSDSDESTTPLSKKPLPPLAI